MLITDVRNRLNSSLDDVLTCPVPFENVTMMTALHNPPRTEREYFNRSSDFISTDSSIPARAPQLSPSNRSLSVCIEPDSDESLHQRQVGGCRDARDIQMVRKTKQILC